MRLSYEYAESTPHDRTGILKTNRRSHTGFRLVPMSVTFNDLEYDFMGLLCIRE